MSNLVNVPKNGSLARTNSNLNFPLFSLWFDDIFNRELSAAFASNFNSGLSFPKVNIKETDKDFRIEMAIPGFKKSDFLIEADQQLLSISIEVKQEQEQNTQIFTRREFGYSSFKRSFILPDSVDSDTIEAKYNDGILNILLPKRVETQKKPSRTVEIL